MRFLRSTLILFTLSLAIRHVHSQQPQCWYPDGKTLANDTPCNVSANVSSCCLPSLLCLDNGLCFGHGVVSRGSCTDKSWGPECPQYCNASNTNGGEVMTVCQVSSHTWTCGANNSDCAYDRNTFTMPQGAGFMLRPAQVVGSDQAAQGLLIEPTSTLTLGASSIGASTVTVTAQPRMRGCKKYSAADMAGVAMGIGLPLLVALGAALMLNPGMHRRLQRNDPAANSDGEQLVASPRKSDWSALSRPTDVPLSDTSMPHRAFASARTASHEMDTEQEIGEMDESRERHELEAHKT